MLKYASLEIISAEYADQFGIRRQAHKANFEYSPRPGYLYVRSRAISSRCNDNFDEFNADEIAKGYKTFLGKPVFVNHSNEDHRRARGVVIDAALHLDMNPNGTPDTWCEVLMEIDAIKFPKLAQAVVLGHVDRTSMGVDVEYSICSACGNRATNPAEYCRHIPQMKGSKIVRRNAKTGRPEETLIYESCFGLSFFENSLLVEDPADPTAYTLGVDKRGLSMAAKTAVRSQEGLGAFAAGAIPAEDLPAGYAMEVREEENHWGHRTLHLNVNHEGKRVAGLGVFQRPDPETGSLVGNPNVWVHPEHQRKGLATAMYAEVHRQWPGIPVMHSPHQSDDARALNQTLKERFGPDLHYGNAQATETGLLSFVAAAIPTGDKSWIHDEHDYEGVAGNPRHVTRTMTGMLPTHLVKHLMGVRGEIPGEHRNKRGQDWEDFKSDVDRNGIKDPIFITVDHGQRPKISEGNHRRDAAVELGHPNVPVEMRYYGHAERDSDLEAKAQEHFDNQPLHKQATYEPEDAPEDGEYEMQPDPSGFYPGGIGKRWRQAHKPLVRDAIHAWKGDPVNALTHWTHEINDDPQPDSGSGKIMRAQSGALRWELQNNSKTFNRPLHRGENVSEDRLPKVGDVLDHDQRPRGYSTNQATARRFAGKPGRDYGGRSTVPVHYETSPGAKGLRIKDYGTGSGLDQSEQEYILGGKHEVTHVEPTERGLHVKTRQIQEVPESHTAGLLSFIAAYGSDEDLTNKAPGEIDQSLSDHHEKFYDHMNNEQRALTSMHHAVGDRQKYYGKQKVWGKSDEEVLNHDTSKMTPWDTKSYESSKSRHSEALQGIKDTQGEISRHESEFHRRGGWSRFFLVPDGHIHSSMQCHSCRPTTRFSWLPHLSGKSEGEAVEQHGPHLCTHCFQSAPTEWKQDPAETRKKEKQESGETCAGGKASKFLSREEINERKANHPQNKITLDKGEAFYAGGRQGSIGKCPTCESVQKVKNSGEFYSHKPPATTMTPPREEPKGTSVLSPVTKGHKTHLRSKHQFDTDTFGMIDRDNGGSTDWGAFHDKIHNEHSSGYWNHDHGDPEAHQAGLSAFVGSIPFESGLVRFASGEWADDPKMDEAMQKLYETLSAPPTEEEARRRRDAPSILPHAHEMYGGYIHEHPSGHLHVSDAPGEPSRPLDKLYRVVHPKEWEEAQDKGYLQSNTDYSPGYTRASAKPDERWRHQSADSTEVAPRGHTLEIDYHPEDQWHASAEGYAATRNKIPLHRVRKISKTEISVAGLAVVARDTGRVLMLQRSNEDESDPAAGRWEMPGGHLDEGEAPVEGAIREWKEELGCALPPGKFGGHWISKKIYQGFIYVIEHENEIDINCDGDDRKVLNPDDPDQDNAEVAAWFDPKDLPGMPALRDEVKEGTDWDLFKPKEIEKVSGLRAFLAAADPYGKDLPEGSTLYHVTSDWRVPDIKAGGFQPSEKGESGAGLYTHTDEAAADKMATWQDFKQKATLRTTAPLHLFDRDAPGGEDEWRRLELEHGRAGLTDALKQKGYHGVSYGGVGGRSPETVIHEPARHLEVADWGKSQREASLHLAMNGPDEIPPRLGTAPIPEGHVRLYHHTWSKNTPSIREHGLMAEKAQGDSGKGYGNEESAGVWAASQHPEPDPQSDRHVIEFHAHPSQIDVNGPNHGASPEKVKEWNQGDHNVLMRGSIKPEHILAIHEPWHTAYHQISEDPSDREDVKAGKLDWVHNDPSMPGVSKAVHKIQAEGAARPNIGKGWWLTPEGKKISVYDHYETTPGMARGMIRPHMAESGQVRVRSYQDKLNVQTSRPFTDPQRKSLLMDADKHSKMFVDVLHPETEESIHSESGDASDADRMLTRAHRAAIPHTAKEAAAEHLANPLDGTKDWHHGTPHEFEHFDEEPEDDNDDWERPEQQPHWNTHLGQHWAAGPKVAENFAKGMYHNVGEKDKGSVFTAHLGIKNPKHYDSETDMDREAFEHAWRNSEAFDPDNIHDRHCHKPEGDCYGLEEHAHGSAVDQAAKEHYQDTDAGKDSYWLSQHPDSDSIAWGFKHRLQKQGHDGVTYGNAIPGEAPIGHPCAITFDTDQIHNLRKRRLGEQHQVAASLGEFLGGLDAFVHEGMAWYQHGPEGLNAEQAGARSVRDAGFKGYVGTTNWDDEEVMGHDRHDFDEDLWEKHSPEPTHEEESHYDEHGDYPDSLHERHEQAYSDAVDKRDRESEPDHTDDHLHHWIAEHSQDPKEWTKHAKQPQQVDLTHGVYATQSHVGQFHIDRYIHGGEEEPSWHSQSGGQAHDYLGERHPLFVTHHGRLHAIEGHHRVAAALQRGDKSITGWHHDLDNHPIGKDYEGEDCPECEDYHSEGWARHHEAARHDDYVSYHQLPDVAKKAIDSYIKEPNPDATNHQDWHYHYSEVPTEEMKHRIIHGSDGTSMEGELGSDFDEYHRGYVSQGDVPNHPATNRWPVLTPGTNEAIEDGWHRFHSYVRSGHPTIPVLDVKEWHRQDKQAALAAFVVQADQPYAGGYKFQFRKAQPGGMEAQADRTLNYHRLDAFHENAQDLTAGRGGHAGFLLWHHKTGEIGSIETLPEHQRKGLATEMLSQARQIASDTRGVKPPKHSDQRTDSGEAWARSTGDRLPRRKSGLEAFAAAADDADNLYPQSGSHHVSIGRYLLGHHEALAGDPDWEERWNHVGDVTAPAQIAQQGAHDYRSRLSLPHPNMDYSEIMADRGRHKDIADAYDQAQASPEARHSFNALTHEIRGQYHHLTNNLGIHVEMTDHDPYKDHREMIHDVNNNKRLKVLSTKATGSSAAYSDEDNDKFRAVHDFFGHAATGRSFDRHGEEAAWLHHGSMFTPAARGALTTETRGQNASLIHRGAFPEQKLALLPDKYWNDKAFAAVKGRIAALLAFIAALEEGEDYSHASEDDLDQASETTKRNWGANNLDTMFGNSPSTPAPFTSAGGRRDRKSYDQDLVQEHLKRGPSEDELKEFDPRKLKSTQSAVTRTGVEYYLGDKYHETGETYADRDNPGNKHPVVYSRPKMVGEGQEHLLLSGHHRAAAALLRGETMRVHHIIGPWGAPR